LNQTHEGFRQWKASMQELSECDNVFVKITAIECIFGLDWTEEKILPGLEQL